MEQVLSRVLTAVGAAAIAAGIASSASAARPVSEAGHADSKVVRVLELKGALPEKPSQFSWLMGGGEATLRTVVESLRAAGKDDDLGAIVIRVKDAELQTTQVEEIGEAITAARAAGKKVSVFAEAYGPAELALASYADDVMIQSGGPVMLSGMHMEEIFLADTLAWIGIKSDMVQVGDYKGASEQMTRSAPSPQWEQNISGLLDGLYANMRAKLMQGRKLTDSQLDTAMNKLWMGDADEAKASGLVDSVIDLPDLDSHMEHVLSGPVMWGENLGEQHKDAEVPSSPLAILGMLSKEPEHAPTGPTIAVVHIDGPIIDGDSSMGGLLSGGEQSVGSRTIRNTLEDILAEDLVKGVVVRINSPGGSATASEVIWQGLRRVAAKKPVWVSVGSMAASGGYYCAVAGDKIYVDPSSIVGSIGVVGGRMSLEGVYEKAKVHVTSRSRGPRADMFRSVGAWTPEEVALVRAKMTQTYDLFTNRVTAGRKGIDLSKTAEGRLFTGNNAIAMKMADSVGGLCDAIADMAAELRMGEGYEVMDYPGPKGLGEMFENGLGGMLRVPGMSGGNGATQLADMARAILGDRAWRQIAGPMEAFVQMRDEPVLLVMPRALVFR